MADLRPGVPSRSSRRSAAAQIGIGGLAAALLTSGAVRAAAQEATPTAGIAGDVGAHIVIRLYKLAAGRTMEEMASLVDAGYVPIVRAVPGFREYYFIETADGPVGIAIFADEAGAQESTERAKEWVAQNLAGFFEGSPTVVTGTIRIHEEAS